MSTSEQTYIMIKCVDVVVGRREYAVRVGFVRATPLLPPRHDTSMNNN